MTAFNARRIPKGTFVRIRPLRIGRLLETDTSMSTWQPKVIATRLVEVVISVDNLATDVA